MLDHRPLSAVVLATALALLAGSVAAANTSHDGWPRIDGVLRMHKDDRSGLMRGTARSDELLGGHGSDTIFGRGAPDVLWGDYKPSGQSTAQVDHLYGGAGDDFIYASHGRNIISGGLGNDAIHAHFGYGSIDCGGGYDTLFISHRSKPGYRIRHCERISFKTVGY